MDNGEQMNNNEQRDNSEPMNTTNTWLQDGFRKGAGRTRIVTWRDEQALGSYRPSYETFGLSGTFRASRRLSDPLICSHLPSPPKTQPIPDGARTVCNTISSLRSSRASVVNVRKASRTCRRHESEIIGKVNEKLNSNYVRMQYPQNTILVRPGRSSNVFDKYMYNMPRVSARSRSPTFPSVATSSGRESVGGRRSGARQYEYMYSGHRCASATTGLGYTIAAAAPSASASARTLWNEQSGQCGQSENVKCRASNQCRAGEARASSESTERVRMISNPMSSPMSNPMQHENPNEISGARDRERAHLLVANMLI